MRSRYTAYVLMREPYLLATWHASTRPARLDLAPTQWIGLTVHHHERQDADHATVEFIARYKLNGRAHRLHETSRFVREGGRWFYVDGDVAESPAGRSVKNCCPGHRLVPASIIGEAATSLPDARTP